METASLNSDKESISELPFYLLYLMTAAINQAKNRKKEKYKIWVFQAPV